MTRTALSLWLPSLPTDRLARLEDLARRAGLARRASHGSNHTPAETSGRVTIAKERSAQRIAAVDQTAATGGIRPGMALADARAIRPGLQVHPAEPLAEAALLDRLAAWCGRFTPLVALDGADGLMFDITGASHLFGGDAALLVAVETGLDRLGFAARGAVAETPEAAWALARFSSVRISPPLHEARAFERCFGPLPLAALRLEPEAIRIMEQAGLRGIGDLLWRPRAPLAARFGASLFERLDALMGRIRNPISPRFEPPVFVAEQRFASPVVLEADLDRILQDLATHLCALMERQAVGARRVEARLFRVDGAVKHLAVGTSRPLRAPGDLVRLFRERIASLGEEGLDTGYGFDVVRLGVLAAESAGGRQDSLLAAPEATAAADLAGLVDRLGARLGERAVTRLAERQTHIPEAAMVVRPAAEASPAPLPLAPTPVPDDAPVRPVRLFERPEPIATVATVPDGPPVRFEWRRTTHVVTAIEGPERIAPEWWRRSDPGLTRDYFRAEDQDGRQFWLFRDGLYGAETDRPRWYVHGLFG